MFGFHRDFPRCQVSFQDYRPQIIFLPRLSASHGLASVVQQSQQVGNKKSRKVYAKAKYDGQSWQEVKTGGLVYTL